MGTRKDFLGLLGGTVFLQACSAGRADKVRIGSLGTDENITIAQIYAVALERAGLAVERHMNLGPAAEARAALRSGAIDVYPEYTLPAQAQPADGSVRLSAAPLDASPCLATTQYAAEQYWLLSLSKCAELAPRLRFAATPEFLAPGGTLAQLQKFYGGFRFKQVVRCEPGTQYSALGRGEVEACSAFSTDADIAEAALMILSDDNHFWPHRSVAPVIRRSLMRTHPRAAAVLERISQRLSTFAVQQLNMRRTLLKMDPLDLAEDFVRSGPQKKVHGSGA